MNNEQLILNELKSINKRLDGLEQGQKRLEQTTVKKTDLKSFIDTLNPAIKASEENIKLFTKAEILASEQRTKKELKEEIKAVHEHLHEDIKETKEDLQAEILASRAAAHEDITKLASGLWKKEREQDIRLDNLEEHTNTTNPTKH